MDISAKPLNKNKNPIVTEWKQGVPPHAFPDPVNQFWLDNGFIPQELKETADRLIPAGRFEEKEDVVEAKVDNTDYMVSSEGTEE